MSQNIILPVETIRIWQQILFKKEGEGGQKQHWFLAGRLTGMALAKDLIGKGKLENYIPQIEAVWRGSGYSKIKLVVKEDGIHAYLAELFPEFFPEHPYAAGTLAGILVYVTGLPYSTFVTIQKDKIIEIVLQKGDEKRQITEEVEIARKAVSAEPTREKVEEGEVVVEEETEMEQSPFEAFLEENGIEIGRVNILEDKEKARVFISNLQKIPSCEILYITQTHPKHVKKDLPNLHQIIWLKEESAEKGEGYIVISPSRIEHQLVQIPKEFILAQKSENKDPVVVLTHIEPFRFTLQDWEAKFIKYIIKINNLCADYDCTGILLIEPETLTKSFISTLKHVLG
ncbi:MAG: hypothetical protein N3F63_08130 [Thermoplasmata archaeon]|nr:hypothetical protein [Thermoplasmata archaeon]